MVSVCRFGLKVMDGGGFAASLDEFSKVWAIYFPDLVMPIARQNSHQKFRRSTHLAH
jgi:hypothetical protein